jgi:hypothetical protein
VGDRLRGVPAWAWLAAIVTVSFALRALLARSIVAPFIFVDELVYSELAKSLADGGERLVRGVPATGYGVVYPALIAPAYLLFDQVPQAYTAIKTINALVMSLAAIPAYLIGRTALPKWWALGGAALAVALPSMAYTGTVMTENAFYPIFLLASWGIVAMLERPTLLRQVVALVLLALALATRLQAIALVPALVTAPLLLALFERSLERVRRLWPTYAVIVVGGLGVVALQALRGRSLSELLGAYAVVGKGGYGLHSALDFLLYHWAELDLYLGLVPIAATVILLGISRGLDPQLQRLLAASVAISFWLVLVVSVFASKFADRIQERNAFVVAPLFLLLLLSWIQRGAPRPPLLSPAAAAVAVAGIAAIPFERFINESAKSDTLMLLPWWSVQDVVGIEWVAEVAIGLGLAVGIVVLAVPRRYALALVGLVVVWFAVSFRPIWWGAHGFRVASAGALYQGIRNPDRDWIDAAVPDGAQVGMVWSGRTDRFTVNLNEFFNRSLEQVYDLAAPTPGGEASEQHVSVGPDGIILRDDGTRLDDPLLVLDSSIDPNGRELAADDAWGLTLYRVRPPLVTLASTRGLHPDGWSGRHATWTRKECHGGLLTLTLYGDGTLFPDDTRTTVHAQVEGGASRSVTYEQDQPATLALPLVGRNGRCVVQLDVSPTAVPADVIDGSDDRRELGTHVVGLLYRPRAQ